MNQRDALLALARAGAWRKSSRSTAQNTCVEVSAPLAGWVGVRDSKLGEKGPILAFRADPFRAFLAATRVDDGHGCG